MEKARNRNISRPILKGSAQEPAPQTEAPQPQEVPVKRPSESSRLRVGITPGDGSSLNYGAMARLFFDNSIFDSVLPFVYGSPKDLLQAAEKAGREDLKVVAQQQIQDIKGRNVQVLQTASEETEDALLPLQAGIRHLAEGHLHALVSLPLDETKVRQKHADFKNQAVAVAEVFHANPFRMLLARSMRLNFLTTASRQDLATYLDTQRIEQRLRALYAVLQSDFSITTPRIAVLCADSPIDTNVLKPLVTRLFEEGIPVFGPYASKEFFVKPDRYAFDAVLCMYKEQMEKVFDACPKEDCCYYTAGLPIVHIETVFGSGNAEEAFRSLFRALCTAVDIVAARQQNAKLNENPLGYHAASYKRDGHEEN